MKKRTMTVRYDEAAATTSWTGASIIVRQYENAEVTRQVTIPIRNPSDLNDFRWRLDEIEADWKRQLGIKS
jgi:hypothetical protein